MLVIEKMFNAGGENKIVFSGNYESPNRQMPKEKKLLSQLDEFEVENQNLKEKVRDLTRDKELVVLRHDELLAELSKKNEEIKELNKSKE